MKNPVIAISIASAMIGVLSAQTRDPAAPRPAGTATLDGRVMRERTPVARASVTISPSDSRGDYHTVTDDNGRFVFEGLPAGRFLVTARKAGWVTSYHGSTRQGHPPGVRVAVENGSRSTIEIPMIPGSVIGGRVVNEEGRPMPRQWPWLLEYRMVGDRRMLARASIPYDIGFFERSTDDRGEFRLFGLPPGTYYLVLNPSIPSGARITTGDEVRWALQPPGAARGTPPPPGPVAGYASYFFPGTPDPGAAQPIVVGPGEVRDGLTFRIGFVAVARVSGAAHRPDGTPAAGASITMRFREMRTSLEGSDRTARTDAQGRFTFQNVPPGDYRISARATSAVSAPPATPVAAAPPAGRPSAPPAAPTLDLWGQADVAVNGHDIQDVGLTLAPASTITGRIVFDGTAMKPPDNLTSIRLQFIATQAMALAMTGAGSGGALNTATVQADGTFRVEGLPPDRYVTGASWPGMRTGDGTTGWWLTTIRVGARDLGDLPLEVEANSEVRDVTLTFRDRIGSVEGLLTDAAGRPAPEYFVLAFPAERASWTSMSRRAVPAVRPSTDGRFRVVGLLAGDYYLAVVTALDQDDATDPAFLEAILPSAIRISIAEGETKRQDLRIGR
jgi:hypothetical protein